MKYFKFTILLPVILGGVLLNSGFVSAAITQCSELSSQYGGTNCQASCSGGYPVSVSAGTIGCQQVNTSYVCCGKQNSSVSEVAAAAPLGETVTILGGSVDTGSLNGFMQLAINISKWILGISGSVTLLMFVYGGLKMLLSEGSSDKVTEAKGIITGAVIGLFIIFASYTIIGFALNTMGISKEDTGWASSGWWPKTK